jgi:uncharacterized membrane protein
MKHKKIKLFKIYFIISILVVITIFLLIGVVKYFLIYSDTELKYKNIKKEIAKERLNSEKNENFFKRNKFDKEIEKEITNKYMVKRPGEEVIELIE